VSSSQESLCRAKRASRRQIMAVEIQRSLRADRCSASLLTRHERPSHPKARSPTRRRVTTTQPHGISGVPTTPGGTRTARTPSPGGVAMSSVPFNVAVTHPSSVPASPRCALMRVTRGQPSFNGERRSVASCRSVMVAGCTPTSTMRPLVSTSR
jgi:hypothetical protein